MKTEKRKRLFECFICKKRASKLSNVKRHLKTHDELVRRVKCGKCQSTFSNKFNFQTHCKSRHRHYRPTEIQWIVVASNNQRKKKPITSTIAVDEVWIPEPTSTDSIATRSRNESDPLLFDSAETTNAPNASADISVKFSLHVFTRSDASPEFLPNVSPYISPNASPNASPNVSFNSAPHGLPDAWLDFSPQGPHVSQNASIDPVLNTPPFEASPLVELQVDEDTNAGFDTPILQLIGFDGPDVPQISYSGDGDLIDFVSDVSNESNQNIGHIIPYYSYQPVPFPLALPNTLYGDLMGLHLTLPNNMPPQQPPVKNEPVPENEPVPDIDQMDAE